MGSATCGAWANSGPTHDRHRDLHGRRGDGRATKEALRQGMDALLRPLKQAAREKALHWKLVCCGGRSETFRRFRNEVTTASDTFVVLLVDAEESVHGSPCAHLHACDGWDMGFADDDAVHLMAQVMETWIVADSAALRRYYGRGFDENALPKGSDLEDVSKPDVTIALKRATRHTTKRCYHKIWHAKDLLARIDVEQVKNRCPHCKRLFEALGQEIRLAGTRSGKPTS